MMREILSAAETQEPTHGSLDHALGDMLAVDVESRLLATLERIDERVRAVRRDDADRAPDPDVLGLLARAAAGDDAPFETRWLAARVDAGDLEWAEVWLAPEEFTGGLWLWQRVQEVSGAEG